MFPTTAINKKMMPANINKVLMGALMMLFARSLMDFHASGKCHQEQAPLFRANAVDIVKTPNRYQCKHDQHSDLIHHWHRRFDIRHNIVREPL